MNMFVVLLFLFGIGSSIINPGMVVEIPFPLTPPSPTFNLPQQMNDIVINQLDMHNVKMQSLHLDWSLSSNEIKITKTNLVVRFDWFYKKDQGYGDFQQSDVQISIKYNFLKDTNSKLVLNITSVQKKGGNIKVHLGGNAKQTVIIQVTNLILNHGSIIIWKFVESYLIDAIQSLLSPLTKNDPTIACFSDKKDCLFLNTSLVAAPIQTNRSHVFQINGAAYFTNQQSGILNPPDNLISSKSPQISIITHENLLRRAFQLYLLKKPISINLNSMGLSDLAEIDSQVLSSLLPLMSVYSPPRNVLITSPFLQIIPSLTLKQGVTMSLNGSFAIGTQPLKSIKHQISLSRQLTQQYYMSESYIKSIIVQIEIPLELISGGAAASCRVKNPMVKNLQFNEQDIKNKLISPDQIYNSLPSLLEFAKGAINGQTSRKIFKTQFYGIKAKISTNIKDRIGQILINLTK